MMNFRRLITFTSSLFGISALVVFHNFEAVGYGYTEYSNGINRYLCDLRQWRSV